MRSREVREDPSPICGSPGSWAQHAEWAQCAFEENQLPLPSPLFTRAQHDRGMLGPVGQRPGRQLADPGL